MNREEFQEQVTKLRDKGATIRSIAAELGVHRSRVERALKSLSSAEKSKQFGVSPPGMFVGREHEMRELVSALDQALSRQGQIMMLAGEPGIGKTRMAQELAMMAQQRGAEVLWGHCYEGQGAPPYWPWIQLIRSYMQTKSSKRIQEEMGSDAIHIAEIVPEIQNKTTGTRSASSLDPEQAQFRLFDSITSFLRNASERRPLFLVLEDLHWADSSSLMLLEFLARGISQSRLILVGTYRDIEIDRRHSLSSTLAELGRIPRIAGAVRERGDGGKEDTDRATSVLGIRPGSVLRELRGGMATCST